MVRDPGRLHQRPWAPQVEVATADALDQAAVSAALDGVEVAYYLIHSLGLEDGWQERDRAAAAVFAQAAAAAGVRRIVYLGGIAREDDTNLSAHLRSRHEVGDVLLAGDVPAVVLQAAVIIGSGSASFEMLRYLTERLPVMVTPRWVRTRIQPIAVTDVLRYLVGCAELDEDVNRRFDIGGPDVLSYEAMMRSHARIAGLRPRLILPVPLLSPSLSSLWVGLVTPVPAGLARPLVESLRNEVVCAEHDIASYLPEPPYGLISLDRALALALRHVRTGEVAARWSSAAGGGAGGWLPSDPQRTDPAWSGGSLYLDERVRRVRAAPEEMWRTIEGIGSSARWYTLPVVGFWRVEEIVPGSLLRLRAEMKLPGKAWLEFSIRPDQAGGTVYRQRAIFRPVGLVGQAYWWLLRPVHDVVFGAMLRNIAATAGRATLAGQAASASG